MDRIAVVMSAEDETQIMPDPVEESQGGGVIGLAPEQDLGNLVISQVGEDRRNRSGEKGEAVCFVAVTEGRPHEMDEVVGVVCCGEEAVEGTQGGDFVKGLEGR